MTAPTRTQGQRAYEMWASASGIYSDYFPWDRLSDEDHKRWEMLAKGGLAQHMAFVRVPADVSRFGATESKAWYEARKDESVQVSMWDLITPPPASFLAWRDKQRAAAHRPWWKFWAPTPIPDLSEQAYWESFLDGLDGSLTRSDWP